MPTHLPATDTEIAVELYEALRTDEENLGFEHPEDDFDPRFRRADLRRAARHGVIKLRGVESLLFSLTRFGISIALAELARAEAGEKP